MPKKLKIGMDIRDLRIAKTGSKTYLEEIYHQFKSGNYDCDLVYFDTSFGNKTVAKLLAQSSTA